MAQILYQTKKVNDFLQIPYHSLQQNKNIVTEQRITPSMQRKNPFKNELLSRSQSNFTMTNSFIHHSLTSNSSTKINKTYHTNIFQGTKISQKLLRKSKKYYRVDAQMKQNQKIIEKDIKNLVQSLKIKKQKDDIIIINLRDKFQTHKKQLKKKLNLQLKMLQRKIFVQKQNNIQYSSNQTKKLKLTNETKNHKLLDQQQMNEHQNQFFNKSKLFHLQIKNFKNQLKSYINNFNNGNRHIQNDHNIKIPNANFKQYFYLAQKSYDSLELLLKGTLVTSQNDKENLLPKINYTNQQIEETLKKIDKKLTLSVLKSAYHCFQSEYNSKQIINKILLALGINPLNEFFFVRQQIFTLFKKLITNQSTQRESKQFLFRYFCLDHERVKKQHFQSSIHNIFKKLSPNLNQKTVENLFQNWKKIKNQLIIRLQQQQNCFKEQSLNIAENKSTTINKNKTQGQYYSRQQIKYVLFNDPQFLWDQIIRLIFLI